MCGWNDSRYIRAASSGTNANLSRQRRVCQIWRPSACSSAPSARLPVCTSAARRGDVERVDDDLDALLALGVIAAAVLLRELIDVLPGLVAAGNLGDATSDLHVALRLVTVDDAERDAAVSLKVAVLLAPQRRVNQHVLAIMIDPDHGGLGRAVLHERDEDSEVGFVNEPLQLFRQGYHDDLQSLESRQHARGRLVESYAALRLADAEEAA